MRHRITHIAMRGCLCAAFLGTFACAPKPDRSVTVADLMDDRVTLDGVLLKCNEDPVKTRNDADCHTARIALERLASEADPVEHAKRNAEFERRREMLRLAQEKAREEQQERAKVDPYSLPVVPMPMEPPPNATPPASQGQHP